MKLYNNNRNPKKKLTISSHYITLFSILSKNSQGLNLTSMVSALRGGVMAVQFILSYFGNYSPSIAMELKLGKEITCK